ncbi:MAG: DEAD/DEAH box helicase family protein, partial [Promethearchaeota archaeon]
QLKYFQYLAILFTEIYLDQLFNNTKFFLKELNQFVISEFKDKMDFLFSRDSLNKLAFWMATGSGKTLILHINYLQFLNYNSGPERIDFDNIILITPNENLSKQHYNELRKSSLNCEIFQQSQQGYFSSLLDPKIIKIIDIHKLTEEKKGKGVTIDVEFFGGKNIIFVDEGHKGSGGEKWKKCRERISEEGFTFEYSATFGQAVNRPGNQQEALLEEYAKSIIFDYSYHYFHDDGFGKDYRILNLKKNVYEDSKEILMLANLLSFFEQKLLFEQHKDIAKTYQIEEPLWIFVGSKVKGKNQQSDILEIIQFICKFLRNEGDWVIDAIGNILKGKSGIIDKDGRDIFSPSFPERKLDFLRTSLSNPFEIYSKILTSIFHAKSFSQLNLVNLKNAAGEIALRVDNFDYFGLITIGDKSTFLKLVSKKGLKNVQIIDDVISNSIFHEINKKDSKINLLIGAKKFIEGWDSWRVSNMGLLNIGKREGTQIIQLFGRGVRLKGLNMSLKRSNAIPGNHPKFLHILETLNIFGIKANYMEQFKEFLESEGIKTDDVIKYQIPIKINDSYLKQNLQIPAVDEEKFIDECLFELKYDPGIKVSVDLLPRAEIINGQKEKSIQATIEKKAYSIDNDYLQILDWDEIFFDLYNYRSSRGFWNIIFSRETLRKIIEMRQYTLYCKPRMIQLKKFEEKKKLEDVIKIILRKYLQAYYLQKKNEWLNKNVYLKRLDEKHANFKNYELTIHTREKLIICQLEDLIKNHLDEFLQGKYNKEFLKNVYFEFHLFQPLLANSNYLTISPKGLLERGEIEFVKKLRNYVNKKPKNLENKEVFLLRNLPKIGVGFFNNYYFYPDFILWIVNKDINEQKIIFIDPHGLVFMQKGLQEMKIRLHKDIKKIEEILKEKTDVQLTLDSFILSVSNYESIKYNFHVDKKTLEENHILFQEDSTYIEKLFAFIS